MAGDNNIGIIWCGKNHSWDNGDLTSIIEILPIQKTFKVPVQKLFLRGNNFLIVNFVKPWKNTEKPSKKLKEHDKIVIKNDQQHG